MSAYSTTLSYMVTSSARTSAKSKRAGVRVNHRQAFVRSQMEEPGGIIPFIVDAAATARALS